MAIEKSGKSSRKTKSKKINDHKIDCKNDNSSSSAHLLSSKLKSACKRCRIKKIKCDKEFPSCRKCAKLGEPCVSVDPATGEDIPRSYVLYLEDTLSVMIKKLEEYGVDPTNLRGNIPRTSSDKPFNPTNAIEITTDEDGKVTVKDDCLSKFLEKQSKMLKKTGDIDNLSVSPPESNRANIGVAIENIAIPETATAVKIEAKPFEFCESNKNLSRVASMKHNGSSSFLGDSSGISFAHLVFTAANISPDMINDEFSEDICQRELQLEQYKTSESFPEFDELYLPPKETAEEFIVRYFVDTNSQLPVLHREFFLKKYFEPIYGEWDRTVPLASNYTKINFDFQLPAHAKVQLGNEVAPLEPWYFTWKRMYDNHSVKNIKVPDRFKIPLFFMNMIFAIGHATQVLLSNINTVVTFKRRAVQFMTSLFNTTDGLEALSGTILLSIYSLMRPNVPGVWYTMGSVLRLTVDMGLHSEKLNQSHDPFTTEIRRRLFWCVYSLDRQICSYFGRPFGIPEESITTRFPSLLDDAFITYDNPDIKDYSMGVPKTPTSKRIAQAMFNVRRIQARIVQVLYAPHAELPRSYSSLEEWRKEIFDTLDMWYNKEVPRSVEVMNCKFNAYLFDLNYYQTKCVLYGLSPKCPQLNDEAFKIVYENSRGTIDVFSNLCQSKRLGYTWVAVHNIFISGMTYLYTVYYDNNKTNETKEAVERYTDVVLNCLKNLIGTCEAASNCFKTYRILSKVVIALKYEDNEATSTKNESTNEINIDARTPIFGKKVNIQAGKDRPLEQFFNDLEKSDCGEISNDSEGATRTKRSESNLFDNFIDSNALPNLNIDGQTDPGVIDLLYQVTSQSAWDELFAKPGSEGRNATLSHNEANTNNMNLNYGMNPNSFEYNNGGL